VLKNPVMPRVLPTTNVAAKNAIVASKAVPDSGKLPG